MVDGSKVGDLVCEDHWNREGKQADSVVMLKSLEEEEKKWQGIIRRQRGDQASNEYLM